MTHQDVISRLLASYAPLPFLKSCDGYKYGDPNGQCTGVATSCALTVDVIREAARLGCNLIVVHEPCFYTHMDDTEWLADDPVYRDKTALMDAHGMAVWRDHDHMHAHRPDEIMTGVLQELGWDIYAEADPRRVTQPETTLGELVRHLAERLHLRTGRVVGNMDARVSRIAFCGHIFPSWDEKERDKTLLLARDDVDVLIPGELIDWTTVEYARDAAQLGRNKAIIQVGHFNWEEPGMKFLAEKIRRQNPELTVHFIPSGDAYQFI